MQSKPYFSNIDHEDLIDANWSTTHTFIYG